MTDAAGQMAVGTNGGRGSVIGRLLRQRETGLVLVILLLFAAMSFAIFPGQRLPDAAN